MPIKKYVEGNLLETQIPFIAHGVNCLGAMGAGIAKAIAAKWPATELKYREYCYKAGTDTASLLGRSLATYEPVDKKIIFNVFSQQNVGVDARQVNYGAIARAFATINDDLKLMWEKDVISAQENGDTELPPMPVIAIPKLGAGLGGGDWSIIEEIINGVTPDIAIHVYELPTVSL